MTVNTMDTPAAAAAPATTAASSAAVASKSGHNNNKEKTSNSSTQTNSQKKEKSGTGCSLDVLEQGLQKQEHKGKHKEKHSHKEKEKDKEKDKELADSVHSASSSVSSSSADSVSSHVARNKNKQRRRLFTALILVMGAGASAAFLSVAIRGVETAQLDLFHRRAADISRAIEVAWADYELFGLWVHDTCHLVVEQQEEEETENSTTILPHTCSYERFQQSYQYISSVGTPFQALQLLVNITNQQRPAYEAQMKDYYDNHQQQYKVNYTGLKAYVGNNNSATTNSATTNTNTNNASTVIPMWEEPFYFALHHTAPIQGNEEAIGLDVYSRPTRKVIDKAILTWKPALSQRIRLVQETQQDAYGIILIHPGHKLQSPPQTTSTSTSSNEQTPHSLSQVVIRIPDLLTVAAKRASVSLAVSVFDSTLTTTDTLDNNDSNSNTQPPLFLGGASIQVQDHDHDHIIIGDSDQDLHNHDHLSSEEVKVTNTPEIQLSEIRKHSTTKATTSTTKRRYRERQIHIADRTWTVAVSALDNTFQPELVFVILGGCIIFMASVLCAFWFHTHMERMDKMNQLKAKAEAEKTTLILETTKQQALAERQLNDFIAHEVRNPLSSAMAALSFISASIDKISHHCNGSGSCSGNSRNSGKYLVQEETRSNNTNTIIQAETKEMREDVEVIDASLQFINELMRNMLDMHRASSKMMKIDMKPIDIRRDVLQAVAAILYVRGKSKVQVLMECHPENLFVVSDRLRLKQIVLNLALNASKFVEEGYIRLRAEVVQQPILQDTGHNQNNSDSNSNNTHNNVRIYVEDSGPGIPAEKWDKLFVKFQDSLDVLNQVRTSII